MFDSYFQDNVLFVVPYSVRLFLLKELSKKKRFYQISFLSKEEFKEQFFFQIEREKALAYLSLQKKEPLSILKEKIELLYSIDPKKKYKSKKLQELVQLYHLLLKEGYLIEAKENQTQKKYQKIYVLGYPYLEKMEEERFKKMKAEILKFKEKATFPSVFAFETLEEEVFWVASQIGELHQQGVPYSKIRLSGITEEYHYLLTRLFHFFKIPITGYLKSSLFSLQAVKDYLNQFDKSQLKDPLLQKKVVQIENRLLFLPQTDPIYRMLLEDALKNTYLEEPVYEQAVHVEDFYQLFEEEDTYTFVLGFNQNVLPKIYRDEDYLKDQEKKEAGIDTSLEKTKKYRACTSSILKSLSHVVLSYKKRTLSTFFFPSSFLQEEKIEEQKDSGKYQYSKIYSQILLGEVLDTYLLYGEKKASFSSLVASFPNSSYRTYQHAYQKIPFVRNPQEPLYLSYSSLNDYALCKFKYYAKYILKAEEEEKNTFATMIGTIYHEVLSHLYDASFDFDTCWEKSISSFSLTKKEEILLRRLKKELSFLIPVIIEQDSKSAFSLRLFEQKIELPLGDHVILKGFIDKIAFCEHNGKTYYVIYDYKTGKVTLDLTQIQEGLFLQLPIYQLLVEKGKLFANPSFTGFFYQQLLLPSKNQEEKVKNLKLKGYVTEEEEILQIFDETYEKSEVIQGLKVTNQGFSRYSRILNEEEIKKIQNQTYKKVCSFKNSILNADFVINPKYYKRENISCKYCKFQDLCFHDEKDLMILQEKKEEEV